MGNPQISFEQVDIEAKGLDLDLVRTWLLKVGDAEDVEISNLLYIFCTDDYLLKLNKAHLNHSTLTDVITFPESYDPIVAEVYISLEMVKENANSYGNGQILLELCRVILHGLLHMCRYDDKTENEKTLMRNKEDFYLADLAL